MGDVFLGFLALYAVDVAGASPARAGLAVAVWTGAGLVGDVLVLRPLRRVDGLALLARSCSCRDAEYHEAHGAPVDTHDSHTRRRVADTPRRVTDGARSYPWLSR